MQIAAAHGARVVAAARCIEPLRQLQREVEELGGALLPVRLDVAEEGSVIAGFDVAEQTFGTVDTVSANAGVNISGRALRLSVDDFDGMSNINFHGVFLTAREVARRMIAAGSAERQNGRIVIVSSITAHHAAAGAAVYSATKAAVAQLGRALAKEWQPGVSA